MSLSKSNPTVNLNQIQDKIAALSTVELQQCEQKGICVILDNKHGRVVVSLFGGHILSYVNKTDNRERLWLSEAAIFDNKTPIRGGIPICWPWFSAHPIHNDYPSHGYARTQMFELLSAHEVQNEDNSITTQITLCPSSPCQYGYTDIAMHLVISVNTKLQVSIETINKGSTPIALSQALHSYFLVNDITKVTLKGVDTPYADKPSNTSNNAAPSPYIFKQETDRIHAFDHDQYSRKQLVQIVSENDSAKPPILKKVQHSIEQSGHDSTVVWNPWIEKSNAMKDVHENGYQTMLCIEAANTQNAEKELILAPGKTHILCQNIS